MTKEEFKKLAAVSGGIKFIENNISGNFEYFENPHYEEQTKKGRFASKYIRKFVPYTKTWAASSWRIGLEWKGSDGCICYAWFACYRRREGGLQILMDHIWKPGPGKKMRRDARWNLEAKMEKKAKIGIYA